MKKPTMNRDGNAERDTPQSDTAHPLTMPKKVYQKPVLSKHEQLHGIGLGSP